MTWTMYRIHCADEALDTVLDARRPDGWVASDEDGASQPLGVSACMSLEHLRRYCSTYGLWPQPGDVVLALEGRLSDEEDRDQWAVRAIVSGYRVLGDARAWLDGQLDLGE
jgi:hypothetical protein